MPFRQVISDGPQDYLYELKNKPDEFLSAIEPLEEIRYTYPAQDQVTGAPFQCDLEPAVEIS